MKALGIEKVDDVASWSKLCEELVAANPKIVADVKAGKMQAVGSLVGQAKKKNPNANPAEVSGFAWRSSRGCRLPLLDLRRTHDHVKVWRRCRIGCKDLSRKEMRAAGRVESGCQATAVEPINASKKLPDQLFWCYVKKA